MNDRIGIAPPAEGEHHYTVMLDGRPFLYAVPGQTGACWNLGEFDNMTGEPDRGAQLHVCDIDEMIGVLEALRDSDVHRAHVARWEPPSAGIPEEAR